MEKDLMRCVIVVMLIAIIVLAPYVDVCEKEDALSEHSAHLLQTRPSLSFSGPSRGNRDFSYPVWQVGDTFNYTQTYFNATRYSSYSNNQTSRVMNMTTHTTPAGTFNVYGLSTSSHGKWVGKDPFTSGWWSSNSSSYYTIGNLSMVATYGSSTGPNYRSTSSMYYVSPQDMWNSPVQVNESWNISQTYHHNTSTTMTDTGNTYYNDGIYSYDTNFQCISQSLTDVLAGNFSTYKIFSGYLSDHYMNYYLDESMGMYVKYESYSFGVLESVSELSCTSFVPGPSVNPSSFDFTMPEDGVDSTSVNLTNIFSSENDLSYSVQTSGMMNVTILDGGAVTFRPRSNWYGNITVTFTADDGGKNVSKDVTIIVNPINDRPYFVSIPSIVFSEGGFDESIDLDDYALDVDNDPDELSFHIESTENVQVTLLEGNVLRLSASGTWYGSEDVGVRVGDGALFSEMEYIFVSVDKINDPPKIGGLMDHSVAQYQYLNFTLTAQDPDYLDTPSFHTNISDSIPHMYGWDNYVLDEYSGDFWFYPSLEEHVGVHHVSFWVDDGMVQDHSDIIIEVTNVNDPPVVEQGFTYTIVDADHQTPGANNLTVSFFAPIVRDPDGDSIIYSWDFGDDSALGTGEALEHTYEHGGNYTVILTITDGHISPPVYQESLVVVSAPVFISGAGEGSDGEGSDGEGSDGEGSDGEGSDGGESDDDGLSDNNDANGESPSGDDDHVDVAGGEGGGDDGGGDDGDGGKGEDGPDKNGSSKKKGLSGFILFFIVSFVLLFALILMSIIFIRGRKKKGRIEEQNLFLENQENVVPGFQAANVGDNNFPSAHEMPNGNAPGAGLYATPSVSLNSHPPPYPVATHGYPASMDGVGGDRGDTGPEYGVGRPYEMNRSLGPGRLGHNNKEGPL